MHSGPEQTVHPNISFTVCCYLHWFTYPTPATTIQAQVCFQAHLVNGFRVIGVHAGDLQWCGRTSQQ